MDKLSRSAASIAAEAQRRWNCTARHYDRDERIERLIERQARRAPDRVVAVSPSGEMTFGELDARAEKLASRLAACGIGRGDFVLVCVDRDHGLLVALLAVLKTGAAFIPVEPDEPTARIAAVAALDKVKSAIAEPGTASRLAGLGLRTLVFVLDALDSADSPPERPKSEASAADPAYGIATSGSSGSPKTVVVAHRAAINLFDWVGREFAIGPDDRGLWVSPAAFDLSIFDLLGLPALGASVHMASHRQRRDPIACADLLDHQPITFWNSTPALLQTILPFLEGAGRPPRQGRLRIAFVSGDWVPLDQPARLKAAFPDAEFVALGGATEATIWSNAFRVSAVDPGWASIPYGRPIQNARYYVLDGDFAACDVGETGELFIAGDCLAMGYLGDAALTESRFVPDALAPEGGARMYRTGDQARFWKDGTIELLGRLDNQVNVGGYRVDLGEVEAAMKRCGFSQAVAVALDGVAGTKRLAAAGVAEHGSRSVDSLRDALRALLPGHMVPDTLRLLDALPLTENGKADRAAIADVLGADAGAYEPGAPSAGPAAAPRLSPREIRDFLLAEIVALRGGLPDGFSTDRPLGEAGLGSLEFAVLSGRFYEALGIRVSPVEFYAGGSVAAVADAVSALSATAADPATTLAPSPAEESSPSPGTGVAIIGMSCRFADCANVDAFWEAIRDGRSCIREQPSLPRSGGGEPAPAGFLEEIDCFDAKFFGITPREAQAMDPRQRLLLEAAWTAVEHAGDDPLALAGSCTGVFVGATGDDFSRLAHRDSGSIAPHTLTGVAPSILANRVSFALDLRGPSECVDTACSSSLVALHRAVAAIEAGECDAALVGGVSLMLDDATQLSLQRIGMLSATGACRTFDSEADGYVRGEGVAVVYLKRPDDAKRSGNPVQATILASAVNHNGRSVSLTAPTPEGQKQVVLAAHRKAGIDLRTLGMIETHGTGTPLGDPIETRALVEAFAELCAEQGRAPGERQHCALSAVKANVGHLEAAAGLAGLIKAVLAASHGVVPPMPHLRRLNEHIDLSCSPFFISAAGGGWPVAPADAPRRAAISSFGFGGTNVHVVIESTPEPPAQAPQLAGTAPHELILVSAREPDALRDYAGAYADRLDQLIAEGAGDAALARVGATSRLGRPSLEQRFACIAGTLAEARDAFRSFGGGGRPGDVAVAAGCDPELETLARRWAGGDDVEWATASCLAGRDIARIVLPTYPFRRTRHWPSFLGTGAAVGRPSSDKSEGQADVPFSRFVAMTAQHQIAGSAVIPCAAFLQVILEQAWHLTGSDSILLEQVRLIGNIKDSAIPETLNVRWSRRADAYRIEVAGAETSSPYCRARARRAAESGSTVELPAHDGPALDEEAVYERLRDWSVELGPALRTIRRASWNDAFCLVALSDDGSPELGAASAIDSALQAALLWQLETERPDGLPIPVSIDAVTVHRSPPPGCTALVTAAGRGGDRLAPRRTDLMLVDQAGEVCARLEGVAAVERPRSDAPINVFRKVMRRAATLREATSVAAPLALAIGFDTIAERLQGEGLAEVVPMGRCEPADSSRIERVLEDSPATTFIVDAGSVDWPWMLDTMAMAARALMRRTAAMPLRLLAVSLHREAATDGLGAGTALAALCRTVRVEAPSLAASSLRLNASSEPDWRDAASFDTLRSVILAGEFPPEAEIACDSRELSLPDFVIVQGSGPPSDAPFRPRGVYLVTGGLGGIGRWIAGHLARRFDARVMLCGRTEQARRAALLASLRSSCDAGEIDYRSADVTNRLAVRALVADTRTRFGPIKGVVHCAGILDDGLLAYAPPEALRSVARVKLDGARFLDLETRQDPLDAFVLFSSSVAAIGNAGQCGYAFANGWLEGFAHEREALRHVGQRQGRTASIAWGPWRTEGMRIPEAAAERLADRHGVRRIDPDRGAAGLEAVLALGEVAPLAIAGDASGIAQWLGRWAAVPASQASAGIEANLEAKSMPTSDCEDRMLSLIIDALAEEADLPRAEIDPAAAFETYGIDSVLIMAVTERLEDTLGDLPKTLFFEHRTAKELAAHLAGAYGHRISGEPGDRAAGSAPTPGPKPPVAAEPRAALAPARDGDPRTRDIAIIGMHGRFPDAADVEAFWRNLKAGRDSISEAPPERWDHRLVVPADDPAFGPDSGFRYGGFIRDAFDFDPSFFRLSRREAEMIDPQERLFLMSAYHCLDDAGYPGSTLAGDAIGVFAGVMWGQYEMWGLERGNAASSYGSIANRVSYHFDFHGPSLAIDSMCSSSLTAIHLACASIRSGEAVAAIAGGVNVNAHPNKHIFLCRRRFAAPDGRCRAFGADGEGYVAGEGVGTLFLKSRAAAERDGDRILGLIRASAVNHDGRTSGYTVPNPTAQTKVVSAALSEAGIEPSTISYVEAHGTGTSLGDPIEVSALAAAFSAPDAAEFECALGSVKSNIGHAESAAGVAGVIKVVLQMRHRQLVPSIHAEPQNPHIDFGATPFRVQRTLSPWRAPAGAPRRAGVSSFGAGGANAHVILEEWPSSSVKEADLGSEPQLVPLSARTEEQLRDYAGALAAALNVADEGEAAVAAEGEVLDADAVVTAVADLIAEVLKVEPRFIDVDDRFDDYGLTADVTAELEQRLADRFAMSPADVRLARHEGPAALAAWLCTPERQRAHSPGQMSLADIAFTLQTGREAMDHRLAVVARSVDELIELLRRAADPETSDERIFRGTVGRRAGAAAPSEPEREFVAALARNGRLPKLASLWCKGEPIDWHSLHAAGSRRRLTLPGYPFAKQLCRVPQPTRLVRGRAGPLHPLIDAVDLKRSRGEGLVFRKSVSRDTLRLASTSPAGDAAVGPAYSLAVAMGAQRLMNETGDVALSDIRWQAPWPLRNDVHDLRVELAVPTSAPGSVRVLVEGADDGDILQASLAPGASETEQQPDWSAVAQRCTPQADTADLSARLASGGLRLAGYDGGKPAGDDPALMCEFDLSSDPIGPRGGDSPSPRLMAMLLHAATAAAALPAGAPAELGWLRLRGAVPERGRIVATGAGAAAVLGDADRPAIELHGLRARANAGADRLRAFPQALVWTDVTDEFAVAPAQAAAPIPLAAVAIVYPDGLSPLCESLAGQLGDRLVHRIRLSAAATPDQLAEQLSRLTDLGEIYLLAGGGRVRLEPEAVRAATTASVWPILGVSRALNAMISSGTAPALRIITVGAHRLNGETVDPFATATSALACTLGRELRRVDIASLDLAPSKSARALDAAVGQALPILRGRRTTAATTALRGGRVFRRGLAALPDDGQLAAFAPGERCLIIGGSGVVGQRLSDCLAERFGASIAWVGRRERDAEIDAATRRIERLGGRLSYHRADVADADELREAMEDVLRDGGPVATAFHCGMDFAIGRLAQVEDVAFAQSIRAKIFGSMTLLSVLQEFPVDRLVLMSSAESFVGNAGWGAYACASAFQDGLAAAMDETGDGRVFTVNWGYWEGSQRGDPATLAAKGVYPIAPATAMSALERILASGLRQAAAIDVNQSMLGRMGLADLTKGASPAVSPPPPATTVESLVALADGAAAATELRAAPAPGEGASPPARAAPESCERVLTGLLAEALRISPHEIDPERDIAEYGVDSILVLDFVALIEETLGRMPVEELIEHQSIRAMAAYIDARAAPPDSEEGTAAEEREPEPAPSAFIREIETAPLERADAALLEYPRRLDSPEASATPEIVAERHERDLSFLLVGETEETAVEVVTCGEGPAILFLPGIGLTVPVFHHQFAELSANWRLIGVNAPGHGRSRPPQRAKISALADTLAETLCRLRIDGPVHIVASCFGTVTAQHLALRRPDLVRSLCLCGAFSERAGISPIPTEGLSAKDLADLTMAAANSLAADFDRLVDAPGNEDRKDAILEGRALLLACQRASPSVGMRYLNDVLTMRPTEWLAEIAAPTIYVSGTLDSVVDPKSAVEMASMMPNARVLEMSGAGHYPYMSHPSAFNEALTEFLKEHR